MNQGVALAVLAETGALALTVLAGVLGMRAQRLRCLAERQLWEAERRRLVASLLLVADSSQSCPPEEWECRLARVALRLDQDDQLEAVIGLRAASLYNQDQGRHAKEES